MRPGMLAVLPDDAAVHHPQLDTFWRPSRRRECSGVFHSRRVENSEVGEGAGTDDAAVAETEPVCRQARHPAHRLLEAEEAAVAAVVAEDAREGAPQARMRVNGVRQTVGCDRPVLVNTDRPDIMFIELEIDGASGQ